MVNGATVQGYENHLLLPADGLVNGLAVKSVME